MSFATLLRGGAAALVLTAVAACATSPLGRRQLMLISADQLDQMGVQAFEQMKSEGKVSRDSRANAYVTCVANAITAAISEQYGGGQPWEVQVFDDDTANAFALPGRKIGVHTGLLSVAENEDQLATVIGHEVAHVLANHSGERVSSQMAAQGVAAVAGAVADASNPLHGVALGALGLGTNLGVMKYSRDHESEADIYGLDLMARAGFDPRQSVPLWENMAAAGGERPPEFLSTHPSPETRIRDLQRRIQSHSLAIAQQTWAAGRRPDC